VRAGGGRSPPAGLALVVDGVSLGQRRDPLRRHAPRIQADLEHSIALVAEELVGVGDVVERE